MISVSRSVKINAMEGINMLVRISVENFKSFEENTELTMISSSKIKKNPSHKVLIKDVPILKTAVIYGANAAGKSNLMDVFHFIQHCVRFSIPVESMEMFCKNAESNKLRPSIFEIQISLGEVFYVYGFSALLTERKIISEWLYELNLDGSYNVVFERNHNDITVKVNLTDIENARVSVYSEDISEKPSSLFLSIMNKGKKVSDDSSLIAIKNVYNWIVSKLHVITPSLGVTNFKYYYDEKNLEFVNNIIKTFDTGISKVHIAEISMDNLRSTVPQDVFNQILIEIKRKLDEDDGSKQAQLAMRSDTEFFNIVVEKGQEPKVTTIRFRHKNSFYDFEFCDESDGTRRLFDLIDMLLISEDDTVFVVDELDRSLHPKLTAQFIKLFSEIHKAQNVQLIFTTHESSIMDQDLFRRDEIWFVERNFNNATTIYSLDRFKERYDKKLSKAYLEGRYGALPVFSSFNCLKGE